MSRVRPVRLDRCGVLSLMPDLRASHLAMGITIPALIIPSDNFCAVLAPVNVEFFGLSLHYQNRLRHNDYLWIIDNVGLESVEDHTIGTHEEDLAGLRTTPRWWSRSRAGGASPWGRQGL